MTLNEFIRMAQEMAARSLKGGDAELVLWDRTNEQELRLDPDSDTFDFELTLGDDQLVIEFN